MHSMSRFPLCAAVLSPVLKARCGSHCSPVNSQSEGMGAEVDLNFHQEKQYIRFYWRKYL